MLSLPPRACSRSFSLPPPYSELLTGLLADAFLQDSTRTTGGAAPKSATLLALKFAVLRNLGALRANAGDERGNGDALDAYCQAVAIDSTDLLLWCVCAMRVCLSTQARPRGGACLTGRQLDNSCFCPSLCVRHRLAVVAISMRRYGLARHALEAGLSLNSAHPGLLGLLVETCLAIGDVHAAAHAARQLLLAAPEHPRATDVMCVL